MLIKYCPYGDRRNSQGDLGTDKLFTGQKLDETGLYYYNARYYDPTIGRFISADPFVPSIMLPQSLSRYSYAVNNPLRYNDPSGNFPPALVLVPIAIPIGKIIIVAAAAAVTTYLTMNVMESRRDSITNRLPPPDIKMPTPDSQNMWPNGPPKLGLKGKMVLITSAIATIVKFAHEIIDKIQDDHQQLPAQKDEFVPTSPQPASPPRMTDFGVSTTGPPPPLGDPSAVSRPGDLYYSPPGNNFSSSSGNSYSSPSGDSSSAPSFVTRPGGGYHDAW